MKRKLVLTIVISLALLLSFGVSAPATAQEPAGDLDQPPSAGQAAERSSDLKLISATDREIVLEATFGDVEVEIVEQNGQTYHRLLIPETVQTDAPGAPQLPSRGTLLGVPTTAGLAVEVLEAEYDSLGGYRLYPAPVLEVRADDTDDLHSVDTRSVFAPDQAIYGADAFYPGRTVQLGRTGQMREQVVAPVQFFPVQYNPVSGDIQVYRRILVRVTWDDVPTQQATAADRAASPAYEELLQSTLLNYDFLYRSPAVAATAMLGAAGIWAPGSTPALKIGITEDGIYELTYSDLDGAGFDLSGVSLNNIKITNRGIEQPIYVHDENGDDAFDINNDYILFYGQALIDDIYTSTNVYWLEAGGGAGQRMTPRSSPPQGGTVPSRFPVNLHVEEDTKYWYMPNGSDAEDHWFWEDRIAFNTSSYPSNRDYSFTVDHISAGVSTIEVRARLKGYTAGNHRSRIYLNGHQIDEQSWSGQTVFDHTLTNVSNSYLQNGSNSIRVEARDPGGGVPHQFFANWFELNYWDTYVAENDELLFGAPSAGTFQFQVSNFSSNDVQVFDVTDPANVATITDFNVAGGTPYTLQFQDTAQADSRYLALTPARRKTPASIELDQPSSWQDTANQADYIIITDESFYSSVLPLAAHRNSGGLTVATVKIEDVYDEFNYGLANPQAIRDFLSHAYDKWQNPDPTYVLLVSGATYDYRDLEGLGRVNYVPTHLINAPVVGEIPSDNWFVNVVGDEDDVLPEMYIGRLTAQSSAEAANMVAKIINYEQNPPGAAWNTQVLLVADDDESSFVNLSDGLAGRLPGYYVPTKVYLSDYGDPDEATVDISARINNGSLLVNYAGHGNRDVWAQERIWVPADVAALTNTDKLPVVAAANCLNGLFSDPTPALAEHFLEPQRKGAVAVWAASSVDLPSRHTELLNLFYDNIFQDDLYDLGRATTEAKIQAFALPSFDMTGLVETFVLFGDPAMKLGLPDNYPYVESTTPVNGATNVPMGQDIKIAFSKPLNPATVSLTGSVATSGYVAAWSSDNKTVTYSHPDLPPSQTVTFTIEGEDALGNALQSLSVPTTWSFDTQIAPASAPITGPSNGGLNSLQTFSAIVSPSTAKTPISYQWGATGQTTVIHNDGGLSDSVSFKWTTPGQKTVTLVASNSAGSADLETHTITIAGVTKPTSVSIAGPAQGAINKDHTFEAMVNPFTVTEPIDYLWQATDQTDVIHTDGTRMDTVTFSWSTTGTKTIMVTAQNDVPGGSPVTDIFTIEVSESTPLYLPIVIKN